MKKRWLWQWGAVLLMLLALATPVWADDGDSGTVAFGHDLVVKSGDRVRGDAAVFGANAVVEPGGLVAGDLAVMGGAAHVGGEVLGNVIAFGGPIDVQSTGVVQGDVLCFGCTVTQQPGARVQGQILSGQQFPARLDVLRQRFGAIPQTGLLHGWELTVDGVWGVFAGILGALVTALLLAGLAALAIAVLPRHTAEVVACVERAWAASLGIGVVVAVAVLSVSIVLIATLCLAPLGLLVLLTGVVAWFFGWVAVGAIVGQRLSGGLQSVQATPVVHAAVGTGLLSLLTHVPCIGWLLNLAVGLIGMGAVTLTIFGTRPYPPASALAPAEPLSPAEV